jgi:hypothetical protein
MEYHQPENIPGLEQHDGKIYNRMRVLDPETIEKSCYDGKY